MRVRVDGGVPELDWAEYRFAESASSRGDARCEPRSTERVPDSIGQGTSSRRTRSRESTLDARAGRWEIPELDWAENRLPRARRRGRGRTPGAPCGEARSERASP